MSARMDNLLNPIAPRRFPIPVPGSELPGLDFPVDLMDASFGISGADLDLESIHSRVDALFDKPEPVRLQPAWQDYSWEAKFSMEAE